MVKREAKFTAKFHRWLKYKWPNGIPAYFEIKSSKEKELSISFDSVSEKQLNNLQVKKFVYKFSDFDRMGTPLDMVCFSGKGYVVLYYYRRNNKEFFIIPIDVFLKEKDSSIRRSLTEDRARQLSLPYSLA